jgi:hypothetical protein
VVSETDSHGRILGFLDRNLYSLPNVIGLITSWRVRGAENVISTRENINAYKVFVGKTYETRPIERLGVDSKMIIYCKKVRVKEAIPVTGLGGL